eukprot:CAMPEP_0182914048 /NCGR_PEP_ID=MMETSP0034_2-20130328/38352_1 /TAXON_ID=156128 /ORGANISM="Nephroselmis pyriformis, Strain CCMP717" /LENGTH=206 /DNA_ID=CAMNT_0025050781 /DNA_START=63 /DNA_END=683 /DNA_ORIENTATION=-
MATIFPAISVPTINASDLGAEPALSVATGAKPLPLGKSQSSKGGSEIMSIRAERLCGEDTPTSAGYYESLRSAHNGNAHGSGSLADLSAMSIGDGDGEGESVPLAEKPPGEHLCHGTPGGAGEHLCHGVPGGGQQQHPGVGLVRKMNRVSSLKDLQLYERKKREYYSSSRKLKRADTEPVAASKPVTAPKTSTSAPVTPSDGPAQW